jgi:very-short-patch-repair endonuclease
MPSATERVLVLAAQQAGVVGRRQITDLGIDRTALWRLLKAGVLVPEPALAGSGEANHGILRIAALRATAETRLWAAVLSTGGVLSHRTAANRFGADLPSATTEVVIPDRRNVSSSALITVHRSRRLPPAHRTTDRLGLPMTTAPRTFVDLAAPAAELTDQQLENCLDAWIGSQQVSMRWLGWFLDGNAQQLRGRARAHAVMHHVAGSPVDSAAERELARLLTRAGLAPFVTQYPIMLNGRVVARVDFAWPDRRVALEHDGYRFHSSPGAFVADRQRGNEIELAGWMLFRTTPRDVRERADELTTTLERALYR